MNAMMSRDLPISLGDPGDCHDNWNESPTREELLSIVRDHPDHLLPSQTMNVSVEEIEKDPREYLHRVLEGETVIVFEKDRPVAEMRPLATRTGKRPIGLAKGDFVVPDDFNDPLPDDVLQLFEGE